MMFRVKKFFICFISAWFVFLPGAAFSGAPQFTVNVNGCASSAVVLDLKKIAKDGNQTMIGNVVLMNAFINSGSDYVDIKNTENFSMTNEGLVNWSPQSLGLNEMVVFVKDDSIPFVFTVNANMNSCQPVPTMSHAALLVMAAMLLAGAALARRRG